MGLHIGRINIPDPGEIARQAVNAAQGQFNQLADQIKSGLHQVGENIKGDLLKFKGDVEYGINHDVVDPAKAEITKLGNDAKAELEKAGGELEHLAEEAVHSAVAEIIKAGAKKAVKELDDAKEILASCYVQLGPVQLSWSDLGNEIDALIKAIEKVADDASRTNIIALIEDTEPDDISIGFGADVPIFDKELQIGAGGSINPKKATEYLDQKLTDWGVPE